jgi:hypothetical protein
MIQKIFFASLLGVKASLKTNKSEKIVFFCDQVFSSSFQMTSAGLPVNNEELLKHCLKNSLSVHLEKLKPSQKTRILEDFYSKPSPSLSFSSLSAEIQSFESLSSFISFHLNWMQKSSDHSSQVTKSKETLRFIFLT